MIQWTHPALGSATWAKVRVPNPKGEAQPSVAASAVTGESRTLSHRLLESIPKALGNGNRSNSTMKRPATLSVGHAGGKAMRVNRLLGLFGPIEAANHRP